MAQLEDYVNCFFYVYCLLNCRFKLRLEGVLNVIEINLSVEHGNQNAVVVPVSLKFCFLHASLLITQQYRIAPNQHNIQ